MKKRVTKKQINQAKGIIAILLLIIMTIGILLYFLANLSALYIYLVSMLALFFFIVYIFQRMLQ